MKLLRSILPVLGASALLALQTATAATVTAPAAGDIFIGFRVTGGQGAGTSYIVNIGNDLTFRNATPNQVIDLSSVGDIGADLAATYGASWHTRADLSWGVFGVRSSASPSVYGSRAQSPVGTAASEYSTLNLGARSATATNISSVIFAYSQLDDAGFPKAAFQSNFGGSASYNYQVSQGGSDFGSLSQWTSIEGGFSGGAAGTALDLFRLAGNNVEGDVVDRVGTFTINSSGQVTFTAPPLLKAVKFQQISQTVSESAGTVTLAFRRTGDTSGAITATYSLTNGTAVAGTDFTTPGSLDVTFNAGEATATAVVTIANRTGYHGTREFTATLVSATDGFIPRLPSTSTVTITDVDPDPGALQFTSATYATSTASTSVNITLQRTAGTAGAISVDVTASGGSLTNGTHYTFTNPTTVNFANGATSASTTLTLSSVVAGTINLQLGNPTNFSRLGAQATATVNVAGETGTLSFSQAEYAFNEDAGTVNIVVVRTGGSSGAVSAKVNTAPGTAVNTGGASRDFDPVTDVTVSFADGVTTPVSVPITLINSVANEPNEHFTAALSNPTGDVTLGAATTVRILDLDTAVPNVTISTPKKDALAGADTGGTLTITGTATDNKGVQRVEVVLNGGSTQLATLTPSGSPLSTTWSVDVVPQTGRNSVVVKAYDYRGLSKELPAHSFITTRPLPILFAGTGTGTVSPGFTSPTSYREVGKSITIAATPQAASGIEPGSIFTGWTIGGTDVAQGNAVLTNDSASRIGVAKSSLIKPTLTFIFREGLTLTANFGKNTYPAKSGVYNGLVETTTLGEGISPNSTEGYFNAEVQPSGAFSAKLTIDGFVLNLAGVFDASGKGLFGTARTETITVARTNKPSLKVTLNAPTTAPYQITGTVTQTAFQQSKVVGTSSVTADRAYYGTQILPGKILSKTATHTTLQLANAENRTVGEVVTGAGIPAGSLITAVNLPDQIVIGKVATGALNATPSLTFTRDVPDYYLTISGAVKNNGSFTSVLPPKDPFYSRTGTFDEGTDLFTPDDVEENEFENGDAISFVDDGNLPAELNTGDAFEVTGKTGNAFQIRNATDNQTVVLSADVDLEVILEPGTRQPVAGYERSDYPQGYGYGTVSVTKAGLVTFTTLLADGTASFTASSTISQPVTTGDPEDLHDGVVALFAPLYNKLGFLSGFIKLDDLAADSDLFAADLKWLRPAITTSHYYPAGWPDVLNVGLKAAKFVSLTGTASKSVLKAPDSPGGDLLGEDIEEALDDSGNAELTFGDGQLTESLSKLAFLSTTDLVTKVPDNDPTFTLVPVHATGVFSGKFDHTDDTKPDYKGTFYQKGTVAGGYGFFLTKQVVLDYTGESGWVEIVGEAETP